MIIETVAVEVDMRVGCLDHMVGMAVEEAHIIAVKEIALIMRSRILVMMLPDGIQSARMEMKVGAISQVPRSKILLERRLFLVAGVPVEVEMAVVATLGVVVVVPLTVMAGVMGGTVVMLEVGVVVVVMLTPKEVLLGMVGQGVVVGELFAKSNI